MTLDNAYSILNKIKKDREEIAKFSKNSYDKSRAEYQLDAIRDSFDIIDTYCREPLSKEKLSKAGSEIYRHVSDNYYLYSRSGYRDFESYCKYKAFNTAYDIIKKITI